MGVHFFHAKPRIHSDDGNLHYSNGPVLHAGCGSSVSWITPEEAAAKKAKADKEGYRPTPRWLLKKFAKRSQDKATVRAREKANRALKRAEYRGKRKARSRANLNKSGPYYRVSDYDEDAQREHDAREDR